MRYNGMPCSACLKKFTEADDVVVCPRCGTPEHKDCWNENKECANALKHDEGFIWRGENEKPSTNEQQEFQNESANEFAYDNANERKEFFSCPNCGEANELGEPSCIYCGARLYLNNPPMFNENAYTKQNANTNTYANTDIHIDGVPAAEVAAYVQQNSHTYIKKFVEMDSLGSNTSWNWTAFFFPHYWFFYRRMYKLGIITLTILMLTVIISNAPRGQLEFVRESNELSSRLDAGDLTRDEYWHELNKLDPPSSVPTILASGIYLILRLYLGLYANTFFRKKINTDITKIRAEAPDAAAYKYLLEIKGGGSLFILMLSVALRFLLEKGIIYALMWLLL